MKLVKTHRRPGPHLPMPQIPAGTLTFPFRTVCPGANSADVGTTL